MAKRADCAAQTGLNGVGLKINFFVKCWGGRNGPPFNYAAVQQVKTSAPLIEGVLMITNRFYCAVDSGQYLGISSKAAAPAPVVPYNISGLPVR